MKLCKPGEPIEYIPKNGSWNHGIDSEPETYTNEAGSAWLKPNSEDTTVQTIFNIQPKIFWDDQDSLYDAMGYVETIMKAVKEAREKWEEETAKRYRNMR